MNKRLFSSSEPNLGPYFLCLILFALCSLYFSVTLAIIQGIVVAFLYLYLHRNRGRRRKEMLRYMEGVSANMNSASRNTMLNAPIPMVIFHPETDEVVWSNDRFLDMADEQDYLFDTRLSVAIPDFDARWLLEGKTECPKVVSIGSKWFMVYGNLTQTENKRGRPTNMATTYWVDVTEYAGYQDAYTRTRPVAALILIDNYEEAIKNLDEADRTYLVSQVNKELAAWVAPTGGLFSRYDRDRYLFVFEEQYLPAFIESKFDLLDKIREIKLANGVSPTLSIGLGKDSPVLKELLQYASLSIEMALSRGGDQAVIKSQDSFAFYGGHSKEMEKRTKVKSRVMASTLSALMVDSSCVFVMGHKFPDFDCIGAIAGICAIARKKGVAVHIIKEVTPNPSTPMVHKLSQLAEYKDAFVTPQEAMVIADPRSLLVVVDTNRPEQVQYEPLLECCTRVAVIDHHRRAASYIANAALNFHEPYASSACELVTELIQYIMEPADLLRLEAEALLAGMVLDTKQFTMRTGSRTFEAAAFLRRSGADTGDVRQLFENNLEETVARYDIIRSAKPYREGIAVACMEYCVERITAAKAADELLNISGIDTSFVLFPNDTGDKVIISARSTGETNVQVVLESLGGGGNAAAAGAQVESDNVELIRQQIYNAIDQYFEAESNQI